MPTQPKQRSANLTALRAVPRPLPNLPVSLTPLIGREREIAAACDLLLRTDLRLLTLSGPGGVGKTRLALGIAAGLFDAYAAEVCFVPLEAVTDPGIVVAAIAQALDVHEGQGRSLQQALTAHLQRRPLLLILDNFEHVLAAAPLVTDLLGVCPDLTVLVTSREALRVHGEQELPVPPLDLPQRTQSVSPEAVSESAAVRLFIERARQSGPGFALTEHNAAAVAEICRRLDGLPLALELAAVRLKVLSPRELLTRLEHRLALLTGGTRDAPARQQTLRDTIAWSHNLLTQPEQTLFRRLAVFAGGCTLAAAEAVCNAGGDLEGEVLDGIASLVDKSLLQQGIAATALIAPAQESGGRGGYSPHSDEPRFAMLATLREYALEQLELSGESEAIRRRHAHVLVEIAAEAAPDLERADRHHWVARLETEHENLRSALSWLLSAGEVETGVRLATALAPFWSERGHLSEGRSWLERALAMGGPQIPAALRAKALTGAGMLAMLQSDGPGARAFLEESLTLWRARGNAQGAADTLSMLAHAVHFAGDIPAMVAMGEQSLALYQQLDDRQGMAGALGQLGHAAWHQHEYASAQALLSEALALLRERPSSRPVWNPFMSSTHVLWTLGNVARDQADYPTAHALYAEGMAAAQEQGSAFHMAILLDSFASLAAAEGQPARAARLLGAAEAVRHASDVALAPVYRRDFYDAIIATVQAALDTGTLTAAWAEGRAMSWEQAIAYGVADTVDPPTLSTRPIGSRRARLGADVYPDGLTERELDVLRLLAAGKSNGEIAGALVISLNTVLRHVTHILQKSGAANRTEAAIYAQRRGLTG